MASIVIQPNLYKIGWMTRANGTAWQIKVITVKVLGWCAYGARNFNTILVQTTWHIMVKIDQQKMQ